MNDTTERNWENQFRTRLRTPRSDTAREIEAFLISTGLRRKTKDLVLKVRFGDRVTLEA